MKNQNKANIMYLVQIIGGSWDDSYKKSLFVTSDKQYASRYVRRFNDILLNNYNRADKISDCFDNFMWKNRFVNNENAFFQKIELR